MKISALIARLEAARDQFGDLPVMTWDGPVEDLRLEPSRDGVALKSSEAPNEIVLELMEDF